MLTEQPVLGMGDASSSPLRALLGPGNGWGEWERDAPATILGLRAVSRAGRWPGLGGALGALLHAEEARGSFAFPLPGFHPGLSDFTPLG